MCVCVCMYVVCVCVYDISQSLSLSPSLYSHMQRNIKQERALLSVESNHKVHIHTYIHTCTNRHTHTQTNRHTHTYIHTYILLLGPRLDRRFVRLDVLRLGPTHNTIKTTLVTFNTLLHVYVRVYVCMYVCKACVVCSYV